MAEHEKLTFDELIRHWAKEKPDQVALEQEGSALTFAELEDRSRKVVAMLRARGLEKGDRIAWLGKNARHYFELFYSAARLGIVMVPIGWRLAAPEIAYILGDTGAKLLFIDEGFGELADKACGQMDAAPPIVDTPTARAEIAAAQP
ncbi:MAG TPA: acyl-CoA synthetase, partial [Erythrobacter sp.]|nr:acyl-CoA synthetase [Erythrobacter sp.]